MKERDEERPAHEQGRFHSLAFVRFDNPYPHITRAPRLNTPPLEKECPEFLRFGRRLPVISGVPVERVNSELLEAHLRKHKQWFSVGE